jgi:hypothetical protein
MIAGSSFCSPPKKTGSITGQTISGNGGNAVDL